MLSPRLTCESYYSSTLYHSRSLASSLTPTSIATIMMLYCYWTCYLNCYYSSFYCWCNYYCLFKISSTLTSMSSCHLVSARTCSFVTFLYHYSNSSMYAYSSHLILHLNSYDLMIMSLCQMLTISCRCCCRKALSNLLLLLVVWFRDGFFKKDGWFVSTLFNNGDW